MTRGIYPRISAKNGVGARICRICKRNNGIGFRHGQHHCELEGR